MKNVVPFGSGKENEINAVPECFESIKLRCLKYRDLSLHVFQPSEKKFMVGELNGTHNLLEHTFVSKVTGQKKKSAYGLSSRYNIPSSNIDRWVSLSREGRALMPDIGGRPPFLDEKSKQNLASRVKVLNSDNRGIFIHELPGYIQEEQAKTMKRQGKRVMDGQDIVSSESFQFQMKKEMKLVGRAAQDLSNPRMEALKDIRNVYRIACGFDAFSGLLPAVFKWNADATTAVVSRTGTGALTCYIPDRSEKVKLDSTRLPGDLNLLLKWVQMCSAAGEESPTTLIMTIANIPDGAFFVEAVDGLSSKSDIGAYGWVYFCNSRGGNKALWIHWFKFVVIPTLERCRLHHGPTYLVSY